jgi:hypothetical protein
VSVSGSGERALRARDEAQQRAMITLETALSERPGRSMLQYLDGRLNETNAHPIGN